MSRSERLEQDMVSEQKDLLGFVSYRQGGYLGVSIVVLYAFVPYMFRIGQFLGGIILGLVASLLFIVPYALAIWYIAFTRHPQTNYFRDKHFLIRFNNRHDIGKWRRGTNRNLKNFEEMGQEE